MLLCTLLFGLSSEFFFLWLCRHRFWAYFSLGLWGIINRGAQSGKEKRLLMVAANSQSSFAQPANLAEWTPKTTMCKVNHFHPSNICNSGVRQWRQTLRARGHACQRHTYCMFIQWPRSDLNCFLSNALATKAIKLFFFGWQTKA